MNAFPVITLLTDFGPRDPYVGMMKGVILSINPKVSLIDISHEVRAGSIAEAARILQEICPFFPEKTIHLVVVDPGVGSERRPIVANAANQFFVGPDNGLFWPVIANHEDAKAFHLNRQEFFLSRVSKTFHGRDIFAPVAAHLSLGVDPSLMGSPVEDPVQANLSRPLRQGDFLIGQVVRVDRFGNLITNICRDELEGLVEGDRTIIRVGGLVIEGLMSTYTKADKGALLALIDSSDCLEIAVNSGRACDLLGLGEEGAIGVQVEISRTSKP